MTAYAIPTLTEYSQTTGGLFWRRTSRGLDDQRCRVTTTVIAQVCREWAVQKYGSSSQRLKMFLVLSALRRETVFRRC